MIDIANIWRYALRRGSNQSHHPRDGACLFDAGMWLKYGKISDKPPCSCPIIRAYAVALNDSLEDGHRQRLRPFILRVVGNRDEKAEAERLRFIVMGAIKNILPLVFDGHYGHYASALRRLPNDASYKLLCAVLEDAYRSTVHMDDVKGAIKNSLNIARHAIENYEYGMRTKEQETLLSAAGSSGSLILYVQRAEYYFTAKPVPVPINLFEKPANMIVPPNIIVHKPGEEAVDAAITLLDGVLKIGKQSEEFDEGKVVAAVERFEWLRAEPVE